MAPHLSHLINVRKQVASSWSEQSRRTSENIVVVIVAVIASRQRKHVFIDWNSYTTSAQSDNQVDKHSKQNIATQTAEYD